MLTLGHFQTTGKFFQKSLHFQEPSLEVKPLAETLLGECGFQVKGFGFYFQLFQRRQEEGADPCCVSFSHISRGTSSHVRSIPASHRDVEGTGSLPLPLHWPHLFRLCVFWGESFLLSF